MMKLNTLLTWLLPVIITVSACHDKDSLDLQNRDIDKNALSVTAYLDKSYATYVTGEIDRTAGMIVFNFPYYSSDTEPVTTKIDDLILSASLPDGAIIEPKLSMIRDMTNPASIKITYVNGAVEQYQLIANLVKSDKKEILDLVFSELSSVKYSIGEKDGENTIFIYRTSYALYEELKTAIVSFIVSPWATCSVENGTIMDMTERNKITVTAQDGTTKDYYTEISDPEYVPEGEIGAITALFGWQLITTEPLGFVGNQNRSIAIAGNELVVANDNGNFLRFNRFTGKKLDKTVNTDGTGNVGLMGVDADDNGILIAVTFSMIGNTTFSNTVDLFVWKDGLDSPPAKIMSKPAAELIVSGDIGRTVSVKGDLISGNAQVGILAKTLKTGFLFKVENGIVVNADNPWKATYGVAFNNNGKVIPMTPDTNTPYILSGIDGRMHYYCTISPGSTLAVDPGGNWWGSDVKGSDYIEFNGVKLLATQNGLYGTDGKDNYNRLAVADITVYSTNAFTGNRIMDSRLQNFDPNVSGSANATATGMTSYYHGSGVVGDNGNFTGDVCFGKSDDGSAVQVYLMTTGQGVFGYDISRFVSN